MAGHTPWRDIEHKSTEEQVALHRLAYGDMLIVTIPRDDFAKLMDHIASLEQDKLHSGVPLDMVDDLSRIASDLSQQADAQDV